MMVAIIGGIAVGIAIALNLVVWDDAELDETLPPPPSEQEVLGGIENAPTTQQLETADAASQNTAALPPDGPKPIAPSFDVVRINPGGNAVIAGRAAPGAEVEIYEGDKYIGSVTADQRGEWVFVPSQPLTTGNRQLSLRSRDKDGNSIPSDQVVMILVPEAEGEDNKALVVAAPSDGSAGTQVLQKPGSQVSIVLGVDAMDYDERGEINLSGTATPGSLLNIYIDNTYFGTAQANENGRWRLVPDSIIAPGQYELRVDQVDDAGNVMNRVAMPFVRENITKALEPGTFYVVQPGNSLWRIARRTYGRGEQYTLIFEANAGQIRDPDLIYPGQLFTLPE
ncbi:MAG: Ig-like domain-containing protein [Rhodospirillales bacterium]